MSVEALIKDQVAALIAMPSGRHKFSFQFGENEVPTIFKSSGRAKTLLVSFHGAINRETREIPSFSPLAQNMGGDIAQLSVSDPSMLLDGSFSMSWYAGHEGFRSQDILSQIFAEIVRQGAYERVVFYGSSGGGFASLFYSSLLPNSIAIPLVPQTSMHSYSSGHIQRYREGCWPKIGSNADLEHLICSDLCKWYKKLRPNTVIYVQSAGDHVHTRLQLAPFLSAISQVKGARYIINSGYWGRLGHSGAVPPVAYLPWIRAACLSSTIEVDDLLQTHHDLVMLGSATDAAVPAKGAKEQKFSEQDLHMANLLSDYHLRQSEEA